jgi:hypothetical protein
LNTGNLSILILKRRHLYLQAYILYINQDIADLAGSARAAGAASLAESAGSAGL